MTQPLEALLELERRGSAPDRFRPILQELDQAGMLTASPNGLPQIANVVELYARGVITDRANPDWNRDLYRRYFPLMQRLVGTGLVNAYIPQNQRDNDYQRLAAHGITYGLSDEIRGGLGAVRDVVGGYINGANTNLSDSYDYNLAVERAQIAQARRNTGVGGVAAEIVGGIAAPMLRGPQVAEGATVVQRANTAGVQAAGYGAAQGFGEGEGGAANRIVNAGTHAVTGYGLGAALGGGLARFSDWRAARRAQTEAAQIEAAAATQNVAGEFTEAGVPVFAPAVSSNPALRATAESIMGSAVGQPLVQSARRSITALEGRIGETLAGAGGRRATDEMGNEIQTLLRRNLTEHSIPGATVNRMTPAEAEAISRVPTGPDYIPPRPRAEPVPPVEVQPVAPRQLTIDDVPVPAVNVQSVAPRPNYRSFESVTLDEVNPQLAQRLSAARAELEGSIRIHNERVLPAAQQAERVFRRDMNELFRGLQRDPQYAAILRERGIRNLDDFIASGGRPQTNALGVVDDLRPIRTRFEQISGRFDEALRPYNESMARHETLASRISDLEGQSERVRDAAWRTMVQNEHGNATRAAEAETRRLRIARETEAREEALRRAQAAEEGRAIDETARMRGRAQSEAEAATRARQRELDAKYEADMAGYSPRFEVGTSRTHSYPTEFSAAYRQAESRARGPIGHYMAPIYEHVPSVRKEVKVGPVRTGHYVDVPQKPVQRRTATMELLNDFGRHARSSGMLPGWKDYGFDAPELWTYLRQHLGSEIADRLRDGLNRAVVGRLPIEGLRDIRTAVRRAASARSPDGQYIGDNAMLRRLHGAMSEDMQTMLRRAGQGDPSYAVAADQFRMIDTAYEQFVTEFRRPLKALFGNNVAPEQALRRLQAAAQRSSNDIDLLRKFYRVASEKGDVKRTTAVILSNMAEGGLQEFLKRYGGLSNEAKKIMFAGNAGELGNSLERLHRLARRLEPYMIEGRGLDIMRVPNMMMGATLAFNIPTAIAQAAGMNAMARLMTSERFLNWLTAMPKARTPWSPQFNEMMRRFRGVAIEELGLTEAAANALMGDVIRNVRGQPRASAAA